VYVCPLAFFSANVPAMTPTENLMTLDEVCAKGRITKSGYRTLRQTGRVPRAYKIGRRLFFDPADVDLWVASRITRIDPVR